VTQQIRTQGLFLPATLSVLCLCDQSRERTARQVRRLAESDLTPATTAISDATVVMPGLMRLGGPRAQTPVICHVERDALAANCPGCTHSTNKRWHHHRRV